MRFRTVGPLLRGSTPKRPRTDISCPAEEPEPISSPGSRSSKDLAARDADRLPPCERNGPPLKRARDGGGAGGRVSRRFSWRISRLFTTGPAYTTLLRVEGEPASDRLARLSRLGSCRSAVFRGLSTAPATTRRSAPWGFWLSGPRPPIDSVRAGQSGRPNEHSDRRGAGRRTYEGGAFHRSLTATPIPPSGEHHSSRTRPRGRSGPKPPASLTAGARGASGGLRAEVIPFRSGAFRGLLFPIANKVEALAVLPEGEPFVFFDYRYDREPAALSQVPFHNRPTLRIDEAEATFGRRSTLRPRLRRRSGAASTTARPRLRLEPRSSSPDEHWEDILYFNAAWFSRTLSAPLPWRG